MTLRQAIHALVWLKRHLTGALNIPFAPSIACFIQPGEIAVDIGAHGGTWTRPLSALVGQEGHVYAFEALPYYAEVLSLLVNFLKLKNVTVVSKAVSDHDGTVSLTWKSSNGEKLTGLTHISVSGEAHENQISVQATTLDAFLTASHLQSRIAFIKCDVEGAEYAVMRGAKNALKKNRPVIYLEIVTHFCQRYGYKPSDLFRNIIDQEYVAYAYADDRFAAINQQDDFCGDVLFVPIELRHKLSPSADTQT